MPRIEFQDTISFELNSGSSFDSWATESANLKHLMQSFTEAINMKGETAQSMGAYFTEVHGAVLDAWQDCISYYRMALGRFNRELLEVDSSQIAIIEEDYLYDFAMGMQGFGSRISDTDAEVQSFHSRYNSYLESSRYSAVILGETADQAVRETNSQIERMGEVDYRFANEAYAEVERLLDNIEFVSRNSLLFSSDGTFYTSGFFESIGAHNLLTLSDDAVGRMVESFFVGHCAENGVNNHSVLSIAQLLARDPSTLSNLERQVLLLLMSDTRVTYYNMAEAFHYALLRVPTRAADGITWLNDEFSARFFGLFEDNRFERPGHLSEAELAEQLRRAQLLTFLSALTARDMPFRFNFENFANEDGPTIGFNGEQFRASDMNALLAGNYFTTSWRHGAEDALTADQIEAGLRNLWNTHGLELIWTAAGFIPHVGGAHGAASLGMSLWDVTNALLDRGIVLSNAEITFIHRMNTYAAGRMGGGVASVQTPNGYRTTGTTLVTQEAMVRVAGLRERGISEERAMAALPDVNNRAHGMVDRYLNGRGRDTPRGDFENRITGRLGGDIEHASVSEIDRAIREERAERAERAEFQARGGR